MKLQDRLKLMLKTKLFILGFIAAVATVLSAIIALLYLTRPAFIWLGSMITKFCTMFENYTTKDSCGNNWSYYEYSCTTDILHWWPFIVLFSCIFMISNIVFFTLFFDEKEEKKYKKDDTYLVGIELLLFVISAIVTLISFALIFTIGQ